LAIALEHVRASAALPFDGHVARRLLDAPEMSLELYLKNVF